METGLLFIVVLVSCLFISAFFSGLETALTSLSAAKTKKLMEDKPFQAKALGLWLKKPNQVLTTILVGNNITNTLAASLATVLAQKYLANYAISAATFIITLALLIFGEITPKTFARHNADKYAPMGMTVLLPIYGLILPFTVALSFFASKLVRLVGGKSSTSGPHATEEDIAYMIRLSHKEGVLKRGDGQLLQSVIEFRETLVKESMVSRTEIGSFDVQASYEEVLSRVIKEGHTRWPVYENNIDNIIGVFHAKDLLHRVGNQNETSKFCLRNYLRPALFVPNMMKIGSLLKEFQLGRAHLAVVVDEYGGTAGIISLEDVLEEIVGEIRDEYDDEESERTLKQLDANNYIVDGKMSVFELGKILDVSFPESEAFDTLGGFLIATHGSMPKVNSRIGYEDCVFKIKKADEKKIHSVHVYQTRKSTKNLDRFNDSTFEEKRAAA